MTENTVEVDASQLNSYARAKHAPSVDAVAGLSKSEALYWVLDELGMDVPEEHVDDHNGNVTRSQIKGIAEALAEERYGETDD